MIKWSEEAKKARIKTAFPCLSLYFPTVFIITDSNWARLRNEILSLAETCHKAFGEQSRHTDWLHNGDVCRLLNISKRTLQHYRDTGVLPFTQIGHKCYYRREDVERLLQTKSEKTKTDRLKNNK